jgi:hypothetical protein
VGECRGVEGADRLSGERRRLACIGSLSTSATGELTAREGLGSARTGGREEAR